ncbi:McKusick-Kaufman/Bardet-Biedl syndromes putative chaperonin [Phytophthora cactorum]|nr:McKusick-Kaufman/Bardet-Biedl syndromes putative chaperonin [Phytophthora cactorum]
MGTASNTRSLADTLNNGATRSKRGQAAAHRRMQGAGGARERQLRPLGRAQLLQANAQCPDALTATSVAERYFANLNLQLEIQEGSLEQIPHRVVSRGLQLALDWSLQYLEDLRCPVRVAVNWSSATSISAVIRGIISSKSSTGLDEGTTESVVIPLIIKAFVSVFGYVVEHPSETVPVQLLFAPGLESIAKSEVWKQTVLLDLPWPSRGRRQGAKQSLLSPPICNARVALFNITIEPLTEFEEEDANSGTSVNHTGSLGGFRLKALRQFGDRLERLGTSAVLSQKIIPKYLQTYLAAKGIFTLDRLSATYIRGVQMLSGATILSDWRIDGSIVSSSLGFLSLITTQILGSKQFIRLHRESPAVQNSHEVTTIAIAAPDRFALIDNPDVVAGAGCLEIHLAALLRDRARQLRTPAPVSDGTVSRSAQVDKKSERTLRQLSQTVTIFADRLEDIAGQLCGSHASSTDRAAVIEQLRDANNESLLAPTALPGRNGLSTQNEYELFGWDPRKRSTMQVLSYAIESDDEKIIADAHILDILQSKKDALVLAIESVSSLARIASVVRVP